MKERVHSVVAVSLWGFVELDERSNCLFGFLMARSDIFRILVPDWQWVINQCTCVQDIHRLT